MASHPQPERCGNGHEAKPIVSGLMYSVCVCVCEREREREYVFVVLFNCMCGLLFMCLNLYYMYCVDVCLCELC